ncbi:hypothetical protein ABVK25_006542 [Lepraria finkii]|uniref:Uncharacterized protein n=1 Tax=Lepraria finkii TaxID=1340010 RepID=A0ABR4B5S1_9LECA
MNWDKNRFKFILNRPIFECEPESNPQTQIAKYVTPQSVPESVFCGAFNDGGGMGSDTYTADPSYDTTPYDVRIIG